MFRALLAHPQEVLHKLHLVYSTPVLVQPTDITRTQYAKCRLCSASWGWASNTRNIERPLILNKLNKNYITLVSLYWSVFCHMNNASCRLSQILASSQISLAGAIPVSGAGVNSAGVESTKQFCNVSLSYTHTFYRFLLILFFTLLFPFFVFICCLPPFSCFFSFSPLSPFSPFLQLI
jgi:hypothetical protein